MVTAQQADLTAALAAINSIERTEPRTLIIDIETMAAKAFVWGLRPKFVGVDQIIEPGRVICFAAQWRGEKKVRFHSEHHDGRDAMIEAAYRLLDEADVAVGWNSARFDERHLRREFLQAGFQPPRPWRTLDLMREWAKVFTTSTGSRKLDAVLDELGLERKLDTGGFKLWSGCDNGDAKAWATMKKYCRHDVKTTTAVLEELAAWIPLPHVGLFGGNKAGCPRCGSQHMTAEGFRTTSTGRFPLWRCSGCGGVHSGTHRVDAVHHTAR